MSKVITSSAPLSEARPTSRRYRWQFTAIGGVVLLLFIAELCIGAVAVPLLSVLEILFAGGSDEVVWNHIVLEFRLPRVITALFCGAALGGAGLLLQTLFRNPLADPFVLGISHGAGVGVALLIVVTAMVGSEFLLRLELFGNVGIAIAAVLGTTLVLLLLEAASHRVSTVTLLVVGLMLGYLSVGLISALMHLVDQTQAKVYQYWFAASFSGVTQQQLRFIIPVVVAGLLGVWVLAKSLNALLLGERYAQSLGVPVLRVKRLGLLIVACLVGVVAAFCGPVAFLGLVAAQVARGLFQTAEHRILLPGAALIGAAVGLGADLIVHLPWGRHVLHLNAVIGLVGAPIALYLLFRSRAMRALE